MGGRTVVGLFGIFSVKGINGRHIDQVDGKRARLGLVALGEALGAIGVAAEVMVLGHFWNSRSEIDKCHLAQNTSHGP
jgi:hypothetical protein